MNGLAAVIDIEARNTCRPAPLAGDEGDLSGEPLFIGLSHPLDNRGLQNRIGEVRDPISRLALAIGNIRMGLVVRDGAGTTRRRQEVVMGGTIQRPSGAAVRGEVGHGCGFVFRLVGGAGRPRSGDGTQEARGDAYQREVGHRGSSAHLWQWMPFCSSWENASLKSIADEAAAPRPSPNTGGVAQRSPAGANGRNLYWQYF